VSRPLDLRLALAPFATYRQLVAEQPRGSWLRTLERLALVALIVGGSITVSSARTVPLDLVLAQLLAWSFVPLLQLLAAIALCAIARTRSVTLARSLELLFIGHLPWSLWTLAMTGVFAFTQIDVTQVVQVLSLLIPGAWTAVIVAAFCRAVLGCSPRGAHLLTAGHQAVTWTLLFTYVFLTSGIWPRLVAVVGR
jgi:hypothetical protein